MQAIFALLELSIFDYGENSIDWNLVQLLQFDLQGFQVVK